MEANSCSRDHKSTSWSRNEEKCAVSPPLSGEGLLLHHVIQWWQIDFIQTSILKYEYKRTASFFTFKETLSREENYLTWKYKNRWLIKTWTIRVTRLYYSLSLLINIWQNFHSTLTLYDQNSGRWSIKLGSSSYSFDASFHNIKTSLVCTHSSTSVLSLLEEEEVRHRFALLSMGGCEES